MPRARDHAGPLAGHCNDLLNDLGKEDVLADIVGWIEERLPAGARPSGLGEAMTV